MTYNTEWIDVGWGFWGRWVLVSTVGLVVGFAVALVMGQVVGEARGFAMTLAVGGAVLGASLGIAQWLILRRQVSRAGWKARRRGRGCGWGRGPDIVMDWSAATSLPRRWVLASTVGGAVGGAVALAVGEVVDFASALAVVGALVGASVGIAQWLILRRQVSRAGWWILASTVGLLVSLGGAVRGVEGVSVGLGGDAAWAAVALALAGYGAITGSVLVRLFMQPTAKDLKELGLILIWVVVAAVAFGVVMAVIGIWLFGGVYTASLIAAYLGAPNDKFAQTIGFFTALGIGWLIFRFFGDRLFSHIKDYADLFIDLFRAS